MGGLYHQMIARIYVFCEILRLFAPENKGGWFLGNFRKDLMGQLLPAEVFVAVDFTCGDRQHGVQQKHALGGPGAQVSGLRGLAEVVVHFFVDIVEAPGQGADVGFHGERQPMRVAWRRVWVLPEDHHAHRVWRAGLKGRETLVCGR